MLSITKSLTLVGLDGFAVSVETDVSRGLPKFEIVGLADQAVRESRERVRSAVKNSGMNFPNAAITVNLAPADLKKEGAALDLAIAVGLIRATKDGLTRDVSSTAFIGELSLDGTVRPVSGALPLILAAGRLGFDVVVVPEGNRAEAEFAGGVSTICVDKLSCVVEYLRGAELPRVVTKEFSAIRREAATNSDMCFVKGQFIAKRAIEVAVSGGHNILLVGAPGAGKTMLAKCIPSIMPDMSFEEALETTKIHSVAGTLPAGDGMIRERPFISPHHSATTVSLVGGGSNMRPGLISLAHNGVLYLDEMPEYPRSALECLRQPLEDRVITVSRARGSVKFPASFMLCASMNPCPCGNFGSETKECTCTAQQIKKYRSRISGPLLDRVDIRVQVDGVEYDDLVSDERAESSAQVRRRVNKARLIQRERFRGEDIFVNAEMREQHLRKFCALGKDCEQIMRTAYETLGLSARGRSRVLKVARTVADLDFSEEILPKHLLEAISYRGRDDGE